jgi:glutathione S-transferase
MFMTVLWALRLEGPGLGDHPALAGWHARIGASPAVASADESPRRIASCRPR